MLRSQTVWLLAGCQALAFAMTPMLMFIGSLIGRELSGSEQLATLPIAAMVVGTALGTVPMALLMQRFGRKRVMVSGALAAALVAIAISEILALQHFWFYCGLVVLFGVCMASAQQYRFMAMESVAPEQATAAASMVLVGGVIAANIGPEMAIWGQHWTDVPYQGAFYLGAICFVMVALLLTFWLKPTATASVSEGSGRPLRQIASTPIFWLAVSSGAIGFAVMTLVMTATPISMHHLHGHSLADTKWVIQCHISAMFLPSLITPIVVSRLGFRGMIVVGLLAFLGCFAIALGSTEMWAFWLALVLLGIGWNFLFVSGTSLLPQSYRSGEQFKVQAFNDVLVFSGQAIAALSSGWLLDMWGWQTLLLVCLPVLVLPLLPMAWMLLAERQNTLCADSSSS